MKLAKSLGRFLVRESKTTIYKRTKPKTSNKTYHYSEKLLLGKAFKIFQNFKW